MNRSRLGELRTQFPGASWAIWSPEFPDTDCIEAQPDRLTEFIETRCEALDPSVVLLTTNPTPSKPLGYRNFHSPTATGSDCHLKQLIQENSLHHLQGGYMTALFPTTAEPSSTVPDPQSIDVDRFFDELRALGQSSYDIICFSTLAFDTLNCEFDAPVTHLAQDIPSISAMLDGIELSVYKVRDIMHKGADHGANTPMAERPDLQAQLEQLNERIQ